MTVHIVKPGENMSSIARQHGISTISLLAANPQIKPPNYPIDIGVNIAIPAAGRHLHSTKPTATSDQPPLPDDQVAISAATSNTFVPSSPIQRCPKKKFSFSV